MNNMFLFLLGETLIFFASIVALYISNKKICDFATKILTSVGSLSLIIFSIKFLSSGNGGYGIRLASILQKPFELAFSINKVSAAFIIFFSIAILIITLLMPFIRKGESIGYKNAFLLNILYICLSLVVVSNNIFFTIMLLEIVFLLVFFMLNTNFENIKRVKKTLFYFFSIHVCYGLLVAGLFIFQTGSGFSEITIYSASLLKGGSLYAAYFTLFIGFILISLIIPKITGLIDDKTDITLKTVFLVLIYPTLSFSFISYISVLAPNINKYALVLMPATGLAMAIHGFLRQHGGKIIDSSLLFYILHGLTIAVLGINAIINIQKYESIKFIYIGSVIFLLICNGLLLCMVNTMKMAGNNNKVILFFVMFMIFANLYITQRSIFTPALTSAVKLSKSYIFTAFTALCIFIITISNILFWIKNIRRSHDGIQFEDIKDWKTPRLIYNVLIALTAVLFFFPVHEISPIKFTGNVFMGITAVFATSIIFALLSDERTRIFGSSSPICTGTFNQFAATFAIEFFMLTAFLIKEVTASWMPVKLVLLAIGLFILYYEIRKIVPFIMKKDISEAGSYIRVYILITFLTNLNDFYYYHKGFEGIAINFAIWLVKASGVISLAFLSGFVYEIFERTIKSLKSGVDKR